MYYLFSSKFFWLSVILYRLGTLSVTRWMNVQLNGNCGVFSNKKLLTIIPFSIGLKDHRRQDGIMFHNLGLSGSDQINEKGWPLKTLCSIMRDLGHEHVSPW